MEYMDALMADADDASEPRTVGSINPYICHCCKSCARKRRTRYLPQDMVFEFLSHLPAQVLHDGMRRVAKEWNLIIRSRDFIHHHLRNSTSSGGFLIQDGVLSHKVIYVELRRGCLEISKLDGGLKYVARTSCNGLVLAPDSRNWHILHIINPLTKQRAVLPPYLHEIRDQVFFGLAFVEASMEYKVVCVHEKESFGRKAHIDVLTVGVDKVWRCIIDVLTVGVDKVWRCIDIKHLLLTTEGDVLSRRPLVTGGYVHWIGETFVLTLNVGTEAVFRFPIPQLSKKCGKFLAMGSNLSFVSQTNKFLGEVWEMNPKTGELIMTLRFNLKPVRRRFEGLFEDMKSVVPFGWLAVGEVLLFSIWFPTRHCIAYNVKTGGIQVIELGNNARIHHFQSHVNSLVSLEGGF